MKVYFQRGEHHARGHPTALGKADDARGLPGSPGHATTQAWARPRRDPPPRCLELADAATGAPRASRRRLPRPLRFHFPPASGPPARKHAAGSGRLRPAPALTQLLAPSPPGDSGARALGPQEPLVFVKRGHKRSGGQRARRPSRHLHATPPAAAKPASETVPAPTSCSEKTK